MWVYSHEMICINQLNLCYVYMYCLCRACWYSYWLHVLNLFLVERMIVLYNFHFHIDQKMSKILFLFTFVLVTLKYRFLGSKKIKRDFIIHVVISIIKGEKLNHFYSQIFIFFQKLISRIWMKLLGLWTIFYRFFESFLFDWFFSIY